MSLSSLLLGGGSTSKGKDKAIDKGLDDLFRINAAVAPSATKPTPIESPEAFLKVTKKDKKRKHDDEVVATLESKKMKTTAPVEEKKHKKSKKKARPPTPEPVAADDSEEEEHENDLPQASSSSAAHVSPPPGDAEDADSDEEGDPTTLVHESLKAGGKHKHSGPKTKYVPAGETSEQRDARTVFVGNIPLEVMKSKSQQKQLKRHLLSFAPTAKIESIRFRSVAFAKPTTQLPPIDGSAPKAKPEKKDGRQHDRERAASWRVSKGDEAEGDTTKTFLTPAEKKRIAFIKQDFHDAVDVVNAYVVFAHPIPQKEGKEKAKGKSAEVTMDPHEAARVVAKEADGSSFLGRTIRTDVAVRGGAKGKVDADLAGDPKATLFVGNLDFASKEEDLRAFFEALMITEKGQPGAEAKDGDEDTEDVEDEDEDEESGPSKPKVWVNRVRIVRDKDTLLGKGFAYVQFADRECVDEILTLEPTRLKFAKRKLRVQRCKTLPGATLPKSARRTPSAAAPAKGSQRPSQRSSAQGAPSRPIAVPKGDPALGSRIAGLSKEDRKKAKAGDADRVARRLAKKRAKALADKGVKSRPDDVLKTRKKPGDVKGAKGQGSNKKGRVRSGKALAKMNTKK